MKEMSPFSAGIFIVRHVAHKSAEWGSNQQLDSVCAYLHSEMEPTDAKRLEDELRAALRPKPPTLEELALEFLGTIEKDGRYLPEITDTIRKALTAKRNLPELQ